MDGLTPPPDFLAALRRRGIAVGLDQLQRLGRLAERWQGADIASFRSAVAALLAASPEEVEAVKDAFDRTWAAEAASEPAPAVPEPSEAATLEEGTPDLDAAVAAPPRPALWPRWGLLVLALLLWLLPPVVPHAPPPPPERPGKGRPAQKAQTPMPVVPRCAEDNLPPPLVIRYWGKPAAAAAGSAALVFLLLLQVRAAFEHRRRLQRYWRDKLEALPAPHGFSLKLAELPGRPPLPREDLEDMATLLGRLKGLGRELDVLRTVRRTVAAGMMLTPVYRLKPMGGVVLLLQDLSVELRPFQAKVEALAQGLSRLGVPIERWYFYGDAGWLRAAPEARPQRLADVARLHGMAPLLIVSGGAGLLAEDGGGEPADWVRELDRLFPVRAWLHPVADPQLWRPLLRRWHPDEGRRGPLLVRPMTRAGMHQTACELSGVDEGVVPIDQQRRRVLPDDVERMRELLSLWPRTPVELVEVLRQRFAPDIPDEVVLHLLATGADEAGEHLRWPAPEWARSLAGLRRRLGPEREAQQRRFLLQLLRASRPGEVNSAARQRWRLACALQELHLPDGAAQERALKELEELSRGPLWSEVRDGLLRPGGGDGPMLGLDAATTSLLLGAVRDSKLRLRLFHLLRDLARAEGPRSEGLSMAPRRALLPVPGLQEALSAATASLFILWLIIGQGWVPKEIVPNVQEAYRLRRDLGEPDRFTVELAAGAAPSTPLQVALYRDREERPLLTGVAVQQPDKKDEGAEAPRLPQPEADRVHCYHVRAALPRGNFALSGQLFVAGERVATPRGQLLVTFLSGRTREDLGPVAFGVGNTLGETAAGRGGQPLKLPAGTWTLQSAGTPEYGSVTRTLVVRPDSVAREEIVLLDFATLELGELPPGVGPEHLQVNGVRWEGKEVRVQPGVVTVQIDHPYYEERREVSVRLGERRRLSLSALPKFGVVEVAVLPKQAELEVRDLDLLEGGLRGDASLFRLRGPPGSYRVAANAPGFRRGEVMVTLEAGATLKQELSLTPELVPLRPVPPPPRDTAMVRVPAGSFRMGLEEGEMDQRPVREVHVASFLLDRTEVTVGAYGSCVTAGACTEPAADSKYCNWTERRWDHPVNCVTWQQARSYCAFAGKRLPTEAEWEYAARGGDGRLYPWGSAAPSGQLCWQRYPGDGTCVVGGYPSGQSPFGALDMAGNVAEWTADPYCGDYSRDCGSTPYRAVRGGSWYSSNRRGMMAVDRRMELATARNSDLGFRCARRP